MKTNNTKIMGILNVTPDSFYDGGKFTDTTVAVKKFNELKIYSDIIDIGAESTRPKAVPITAKEEAKRLFPLLLKILPDKDVKISIDTYHRETAEFALSVGADIINAVTFDEEIAKVTAKYGAKLVLMARDTMGDFEKTVNYLDNLIDLAKTNSVSEENIILDLGVGFLGGFKADFLALHNLPKLKKYYKNFPILIGASRKSFIGAVLNQNEDERLIGSVAANIAAVLHGADILRVHDARETRDALTIVQHIEETDKWTK